MSRSVGKSARLICASSVIAEFSGGEQKYLLLIGSKYQNTNCASVQTEMVVLLN